MSKPLVLLIALLIVSISSSAFAGQKYFSGFAGVNFPPGSDVIITPSGASDIVRVEGHDSNIMFGGAIGYDFANGLRIEEEVSYRNNDVNLASFNANPAIQGIEHTTLSFMTNGYLDMDLGIPVKPYLGVGIGFASIEREIRLTLGTDSDKDIVLAYQLMAGLGYKIKAQQWDIWCGIT